AEARSGCLRPLRLGLSAVQGYQPVHGRGEGAPEGRQDEGTAAASAKARRAEQEIATGRPFSSPIHLLSAHAVGMPGTPSEPAKEKRQDVGDRTALFAIGGVPTRPMPR